MRVKLINCPKLFRDTFPPYGLALINSFLRNNSVSSDIFDLDVVVKHDNSINNNPVDLFYVRKNYDNIYKILKLRQFEPYLDAQFERMIKKINLNDTDVVGLNSHDNELYVSLYLAKKIKEKKDCMVVIGGSHASRINLSRMMYTIHQLNIDYVDYFVKSRPYKFFSLLINGSINKEKTLHAKVFPREELKLPLKNEKLNDDAEAGMPLYNKEHLELYKMDVKKLRFFYPKLSEQILIKLEGMQGYKPILVLPYIFTAGCVNNCAFCFASLQKPFKLDADEVMLKIKMMEKEYDCKNFYFLNNNIVMDRKYATTLFKRLADETDIRWSDASSIKGLDDSTLKLMTDAGCIQLLFGLESASQKMLKYVHKNVDYNDLGYYTRCFESCDKNNVWVVADLIAGFPYETKEDVKRSVEYLEKNKHLINGVFVLNFTLYDNSVMFKNAEKYGLKIIDDQTVRQRITSEFGKDVDVYKKVYYRTFPFDEIDGGLGWEEKQKQVKESFKNMRNYIAASFKTHSYIHYPIFFLYNAFDNNKKEILDFLNSETSVIKS